MDGRRLPGIADSLDWVSTYQGSFEAEELGNGTYRTIPPITTNITGSYVVIVGVKSENVLKRWKMGGWASQNLLSIPISTGDFQPFARTESKWLALNQLTLCVFPRLMETWALKIEIPKWIKDVSVEIWRYGGYDVLETASTKIEQSSVSASISGVKLLEKNSDRLGAAILNASPSDLLINLGSPATQETNTAKLESGGYYEIPYAFAGEVWGLWNNATGEALIDEFL